VGDEGREERRRLAARVARCGSLRGLEVSATWLTPTTVTILARHPYGPWRGVMARERHRGSFGGAA